MGCEESVMPSIPFNIIVWKNINALQFGYFLKCSILMTRFKKLCFGIPNIFVKFRAMNKLLLFCSFIKDFSHLTDSKIIETVLQSFGTWCPWFSFKRNILNFFINIDSISRIMPSLIKSVPLHVGKYFFYVNILVVFELVVLLLCI